jgi:hypothetical protein
MLNEEHNFRLKFGYRFYLRTNPVRLSLRVWIYDWLHTCHLRQCFHSHFLALFHDEVIHPFNPLDQYMMIEYVVIQHVKLFSSNFLLLPESVY